MFIFNGVERNILEFNLESETAKIIGDLPFQSGTSSVYSTTAIPWGHDGAWLFAGNYRRVTNPILLYNATSKEVHIPCANTPSLPTLYHVPVSVKVGNHGYLIGGLGSLKEDDGSYHPTNGILR
jgi:hypothetical protein